ncbi:MAG: hypothetical protein NTW86_12860, partial [Candidatus Sumerlaeota bacterium]|nr:hypothetical protein [Candidatus Sumerlaeota bacterium]
WKSRSLGECLLLPDSLLYAHLLWLLTLPARVFRGSGDPLLAGQLLGALSGALAAGLFYWRVSRRVDNWRAALLGALLMASSFTVWFSASEATPQAPALALAILAAILAWPASEAAPGARRLAGAGLLVAAAALLDLGALWLLVPLGAAAASGRGKAEAPRAMAILAAPALAIAAIAYGLAWRHLVDSKQIGNLAQWLVLLRPHAPQAGGLWRVFLYFKTFKFALLYRSPWFIGLPVALAFLGARGAWKRQRKATLVFGLWALGGALRALLVDPAEIQAWTLAMPGVLGLFALSLDSLLDLPRLRRLHDGLIVVGALTALLFVGNTHGWLPRFERVAGFYETDQACKRLAELSRSPDDLVLASQGYFSFLLPNRYGRPAVLDPLSIRQAAASQSQAPAQWLARAVAQALRDGRSVFVDSAYLDAASPIYETKELPADVAPSLTSALGGPGESPAGFVKPFEFRVWRRSS